MLNCHCCTFILVFLFKWQLTIFTNFNYNVSCNHTDSDFEILTHAHESRSLHEHFNFLQRNVYLFVCSFVRLSISVSYYLFVLPIANISVCSYVHLFVQCVSVWLSVRFSVFLSVRLRGYPPVHLYLCLSFRLSACWSFCLSICLFVLLPVDSSINLSVCSSYRIFDSLSAHWPIVCLYIFVYDSLSVYQYILPAVCPFICLSDFPSVDLSIPVGPYVNLVIFSSVFLCICQSFHLLVCLSIHPSVYPLVRFFVCLSLSVCFSSRCFVCWSFRLYVYPYIYLSVCQSFHLSASMCVRLFVHSSLHLSLLIFFSSVSLSICLFVPPFAYLVYPSICLSFCLSV